MNKLDVGIPGIDPELEKTVFSTISNIESALQLYIKLGIRFEKINGQKHPLLEKIIGALKIASMLTREDVLLAIQITEREM